MKQFKIVPSPLDSPLYDFGHSFRELIWSCNSGSSTLKKKPFKRLIKSTTQFSLETPKYTPKLQYPPYANFEKCLQKHKTWPTQTIQCFYKELIEIFSPQQLDKQICKIKISVKTVVGWVQKSNTMKGPYLQGSALLNLTACSQFLPKPNDIDIIITGGSDTEAIDTIIWNFVSENLPSILKTQASLLSKTKLGHPIYSELLTVFKDYLLVVFKSYFIADLSYPTESLTHFRIGNLDIMHSTLGVTDFDKAACSKNGLLVDLAQSDNCEGLDILSPSYPISDVEIHLRLNICFSDQPKGWDSLRRSLDMTRSKSVPFSPWDAFESTYSLWQHLMVTKGYYSPKKNLSFKLDFHVRHHYNLTDTQDRQRALNDLIEFSASVSRCIPDNHPDQKFRDMVVQVVQSRVKQLQQSTGMILQPKTVANKFRMNDTDAAIFFLARYTQLYNKGVKKSSNFTVQTLFRHAYRYFLHVQNPNTPIKGWAKHHETPKGVQADAFIALCLGHIISKNAPAKVQFTTLKRLFTRLETDLSPNRNGKKQKKQTVLKPIEAQMIAYVVQTALSPHEKIAGAIQNAVYAFCHSKHSVETLEIRLLHLTFKQLPSSKSHSQKMQLLFQRAANHLQSEHQWIPLFEYRELIWGPSVVQHHPVVTIVSDCLSTAKELTPLLQALNTLCVSATQESATSISAQIRQGLSDHLTAVRGHFMRRTTNWEDIKAVSKMYVSIECERPKLKLSLTALKSRLKRCQVHQTVLMEIFKILIQTQTVKIDTEIVSIWGQIAQKTVPHWTKTPTSQFSCLLRTLGQSFIETDDQPELVDLIPNVVKRYPKVQWLALCKQIITHDPLMFLSKFSSDSLLEMTPNPTTLIQLYLKGTCAQKPIRTKSEWNKSVEIHQTLISRIAELNPPRTVLVQIRDAYFNVFTTVHESPYNKNNALQIAFQEAIGPQAIKIADLWVHSFCWIRIPTITPKRKSGKQHLESICIDVILKLNDGLAEAMKEGPVIISSAILTQLAATCLLHAKEKPTIHLMLLKLAYRYPYLIQSPEVVKIICDLLKRFPKLSQFDLDTVAKAIENLFKNAQFDAKDQLPNIKQNATFITLILNWINTHKEDAWMKLILQYVVVHLTLAMVQQNKKMSNKALEVIQQISNDLPRYIDFAAANTIRCFNAESINISPIDKSVQGLVPQFLGCATRLHHELTQFYIKRRRAVTAEYPLRLFTKLMTLLPPLASRSETYKTQKVDDLAAWDWKLQLNWCLDILQIGFNTSEHLALHLTDDQATKFRLVIETASKSQLIAQRNLWVVTFAKKLMLDTTPTLPHIIQIKTLTEENLPSPPQLAPQFKQTVQKAIEKKDIICIKGIFSKKMVPQAQQEILQLCVQAHWMDALQLLILNFKVDPTPAIHLFAQNGNIGGIKFLRKCGVNIEQIGPNKESLLSLAANHTQPGLVQWGLKEGLDPWHCANGKSPFDFICTWPIEQFKQILPFLNKNGFLNKKSPSGHLFVHRCAIAGNSRHINQLATVMKSLDIPTTKLSIISVAVIAKNLGTCAALIKHKCLLDVGDSNLNTPLHIAIIIGATNIALLLIQCGAGLNYVNKTGLTPSDIALLLGNKKILEKLKERKAKSSIHFYPVQTQTLKRQVKQYQGLI